MSFSTIGDLRQHFLSTQNNTKLKTELSTLVEELTTGEKSDLTDHLGISQTAFNSLDRQLTMLERYEQVNSQSANILSTMQSVLDHVDDQRGNTSATLLTINGTSSPSQVDVTSNEARASFDSAVASLNTRYGDRSLFGGTDIEGMPLASADDMIAAIEVAVSGLTIASDISNAIDNWFEDVGGGFETSGYQGDDVGYVTRSLDADQNITIEARADDEAIRGVLKELAKGVFAGNSSLDLSERRELLQGAAVGLLNAAEPMASFQSRIGFAESRIEEASVRNSAEQTSYGIARSEMVAADPFETATRLESVQIQLETQYLLTSRLSGLSLTEYLR